MSTYDQATLQRVIDLFRCHVAPVDATGYDVPHLERYNDPNCVARWHVTVNNHLRKLLWPWWIRAADQGVYIETTNGKRRLLRNEDAWTASSRKVVRKALAFSNNGEDFSLFVDWVAGHTFDLVGRKMQWVRKEHPAPHTIVNAFMNISEPQTAVKLVWEHCIKRVDEEEKIYELKS